MIGWLDAFSGPFFLRPPIAAVGAGSYPPTCVCLAFADCALLSFACGIRVPRSRSVRLRKEARGSGVECVPPAHLSLKSLLPPSQGRNLVRDAKGSEKRCVIRESRLGCLRRNQVGNRHLPSGTSTTPRSVDENVLTQMDEERLSA